MALELHRQHRRLPVSLQEITLLTGAGICRERARDNYILANRLKKRLIHLINPYPITHATKTQTDPCLTPHVVAKEISFPKGNGSKYRKSNSINRRLKISLIMEVRMQKQ